MISISRRVRIAGTGSAVPERILRNEDIEKTVDTDSEWIRKNLGIEERRIVGSGELTSDLAARAGLNAIENAGITKESVDLIIVSTITPDRQAPSTACIVQRKLGIKNGSPAFDLAAVCSGFLYALHVAAQFLENGTYGNVLVIGADTFSTITNWERRDCVFFGDGAGAAVLQRMPATTGLLSSLIHADGRGQDNFTIYPGERFFSMHGRAVYDAATEVLPKAIQSVLSLNGLVPKDVDWVIPHQPSIRILRRTAELLDISFDRFKTNMNRYANTSAATIPLLLDEVHREGCLQTGDLVVFAAVGAGWTWGAAAYRWV